MKTKLSEAKKVQEIKENEAQKLKVAKGKEAKKVQETKDKEAKKRITELERTGLTITIVDKMKGAIKVFEHEFYEQGYTNIERLTSSLEAFNDELKSLKK